MGALFVQGFGHHQWEKQILQTLHHQPQRWSNHEAPDIPIPQHIATLQSGFFWRWGGGDFCMASILEAGQTFQTARYVFRCLGPQPIPHPHPLKPTRLCTLHWLYTEACFDPPDQSAQSQHRKP